MFVSALVRVRFEAGRRGAVQGASLKAAHGCLGFPSYQRPAPMREHGCLAMLEGRISMKRAAPETE